jgi:hypothetical protein
MLKVLWSPGAAFTEIREARARPWIPILVFIVFGLGGTYLLTSRVDMGEALMREIVRSPQAGNMSQEQIVQMREGLSNNPLIVGLMYGASLFLPLMALLASGLYFGIFLILGSRSAFMEFWSVTTFSFTPMLLSSIAGIGVMFTIPPAALQLGQMNVLSPAVFMDPSGSAGLGYTLAQALSLTTLWTLALLIIGYGVLGSGRTSVVVRSVVVLVPWLILVALRALPALIFS